MATITKKNITGDIFLLFNNNVKRKAQGALKYDYLVPNGVYEEQWDWDAYFMGMAFASHNAKDAVWLKNWTLNFIINSREDGYTPGCITPKGRDERLNQMKPFLAQGANNASIFLNDYSWILPHYDQLKIVVLYREKNLWNKDLDLGVWYDSMESGADNNVAALNYPKATVVATDLNSYIYCEYLAMATIAKKLKKTKDAAFFEKRAKTIKKNINKFLWDEKDSIYFNVDGRDKSFIKRVSFNCFHPLWANIAPTERAVAFIEKYVFNPEELWSPYGIRTLSKKDPEYNNINMIKPHSNWQGPIWPIATYFYTVSLLNYGFEKRALEITEKITTLCLNDIDKTGGMHENYNAETGEPLAAPNFVSWNLLIPSMKNSVLKQITKNFKDELTFSSQGKKTSLPFIQNPLPKTSVVADGETFQVLVFGGTNARSALVKKQGNNLQIIKILEQQCPMFSTKNVFLSFLANNLDPEITTLAINFAFPVKPVYHNGKLEGELITGTKEHAFEGMVGENVCVEIEAYIKNKTGKSIEVSLANDSICLLLSGLTQDKSEHIGACIVGTGTNVAFFLSPTTAVNVESGYFNKFPQTEPGKKVDEHSLEKGTKLFEKETSGQYLYQYFNYAASNIPGASIKETRDLDMIAANKQHKLSGLALDVITHSASLVACQLAGIVEFSKKDMKFVVQGSLFLKGYKYSEILQKTLTTLIPEYKVSFIHIEDADILGAGKLVA